MQTFLNRRNLVFVLLIGMLAVSLHAKQAFAADYLGGKKCGICHKRASGGNQYGIWLKSAHANAFKTLGTAEAKETAAKMGIDDPQASGECLKCHATAYGFSEQQVSQRIKVAEGISCESCHGPGKDYSKKSVMENRALAIEKGLVVGDKETCLKCHNEESPTHKAFDYDERWEEIKHPKP